jgi:hypothetical protein
MNAPAMPGRLLTWWLWLNDYEPVELIVDGQTTTAKEAILHWLAGQDHQFGTAIGDEWRSVDGRWSMRGKAVEREQA